MTASAPFSITINPASTAPAWFTALPYSTWTQIGTGSMLSVSGLSSDRYGLTDAWIGAAVDQSRREFVIGAPGGHPAADQTNNAVYVFRLGEASPQWRRTRTGDNAENQTFNGSGYAPSQGPVCTHSYHRPCAGNGRFWLAGLDSMAGQLGAWTTSTFSYSLTQGDSGGVWNRHGLGRPQAANIDKWLGGSAAYDSVTDRVFSIPQYGAGLLGFYFTASSVVAAGNVDWPNNIPGVSSFTIPYDPGYSVLMVDEVLRLLILCGGSGDNYTLNLDNIAGGWTYRTFGSGNAYIGTESGGNGYVCHWGTRRLYRSPQYAAPTTLRVVDIPTNLSSTWTGRNVTLSGSPPAVSGNAGARAYSKFNIVQDMGNGEACLVWYNNYQTTGMWVARLPAGGL